MDLPDGTKLTKPLDSVIFAKGVLCRLDSGKLHTFTERIITQKTYYFAQLFKVAPPYEYNLYLKGPYSPALASDLFAIEKMKLPFSPLAFVSSEMEQRFAALAEFLRHKLPRELELIATFHWLHSVVGLSEADVHKRMIHIKKVTDLEFKKTQVEAARLETL